MLLPILRQYFQSRRLARGSRADVAAYRATLLCETLQNAWDKCPFYRERWEAAGVTRESLADGDIDALPMVTKKEMMERYGHVVTIPCGKSEVEAFVQGDPGGRTLFRGEYLLLNTSGSSGYIGLFFPGLKHYQIVQTGPRSATARIVADGDRDEIREQITQLLPAFLGEFGVREGDVDITIDLCDHIAADPKTGKTPLIVPLRASDRL